NYIRRVQSGHPGSTSARRNRNPIAANVLDPAVRGQPLPASDLPSSGLSGVLPDGNLRVVRYPLICREVPGFYPRPLGGDDYQLLSSFGLRVLVKWSRLYRDKELDAH